MSDLRATVDVWKSACADLIDLARSLDDATWGLPTDLPGWSVRDVIAHCSALECELAGDPPLRVEIDKQAPHIRNPRGVYTERGVVSRRDYGRDQLLDELEDAVARRSALLDAEPLDDPSGTPSITPGRIEWDWQTLVRNRVIDVWVHDQDVRRAVGRPGDQDTVAAALVQETFAAALPYMLAKRAEAPPGASVVLDVTGPVSGVYAAVVNADRRGEPADPGGYAGGSEPTARLTMGSEAFALIAAGRRDADSLPVTIAGDRDLAARVLAGMTLTW